MLNLKTANSNEHYKNLELLTIFVLNIFEKILIAYNNNKYKNSSTDDEPHDYTTRLKNSKILHHWLEVFKNKTKLHKKQFLTFYHDIQRITNIPTFNAML